MPFSCTAAQQLHMATLPSAPLLLPHRFSNIVDGKTQEFTLRELEAGDFLRGYKELLAQLSDPQDLDEEGFVEALEKMRPYIRVLVVQHHGLSPASKEGEDGDSQGAEVIQDRIVASASLVTEQKFLRNCKCVGHIEDVVTHRQFQRLGLAKLILTQLINEAREQQKCYKLILDCTEANSVVYEKCGFFTTGEVQMRINTAI